MMLYRMSAKLEGDAPNHSDPELLFGLLKTLRNTPVDLNDDEMHLWHGFCR